MAPVRWSFDALVRVSGIGEDVVNDLCWQLPKSQRDDLTQSDKESLGCRCMGTQMFKQCYFPGILSPNFYSVETQAQLNAPAPVKPPTPTPYPTFTPYPTPKPLQTPGMADDQNTYQQKREQQGEEYQKLVEQQFAEYQNETESYAEDIRDWQWSQERAVRGAEGMIDGILKQYRPALEGDVARSWLAMGSISVATLVVVVALKMRKVRAGRN